MESKKQFTLKVYRVQKCAQALNFKKKKAQPAITIPNEQGVKFNKQKRKLKEKFSFLKKFHFITANFCIKENDKLRKNKITFSLILFTFYMRQAKGSCRHRAVYMTKYKILVMFLMMQY